MIRKHDQKQLTLKTERISNILVFVLCMTLLTLYAPVAKLIWIDEFLHFALGSYQTIQDASQIIYKTVVEINHGQTGVYMLVDYILLRIFGANGWALRAPSILSAVLMLIGALKFIRIKGAGIGGQVALLIAYSGQINLMRYMGEARPYMPLAGAVVGVLAYYAVNIEERKLLSVKLLGWLSVIVGSLIHPYFFLYWYAIIGFSYGLFLFENEKRVDLKEIVRFINLRMFLVGTIVTLVVGSQSWLRSRKIVFDFNPFEWITQGLWVEYTTFSHFAFIPNARLIIIIGILCPIIFLFSKGKIKKEIKLYVGPAVLMNISLVISIVLAYVSYSQNYWILHRQWIASEALIPICIIWFISILIKKIAFKKSKIMNLIWVLLIGYLIMCVEPIVKPVLISQIAIFQNKEIKGLDPDQIDLENIDNIKTNEDWVNLANKNIAQGGEVNRIFQKYYGIK